MFDRKVFAPIIPATRVEAVNDALAVVKDITVTPLPCAVGDVAVTEEGKLKGGNKEYKMTLHALDGLCKVLGIPVGFAHTIPTDLLLENIQRLQQENSGEGIVVLQRPDETVAGIVKAPYSEASYMDVIGTFSEKVGIKYFDIREDLVTIALTFDRHFSPESNKEDTFYVGTFIYNSILKETSLHMFSGFFRTQCTNSYVAPYLGRVRANYLKEDITQRLLAFAELVACYDDKVLVRVEQNINALENKRYFQHELLGVWKRLARYTSQSEADALLKLGEEQRQSLTETVNIWSRKNRLAKLQGKPIEEPALTDAIPYSVVNDITNHAKTLYGFDKFALEKLAGSLIEEVVLP